MKINSVFYIILFFCDTWITNSSENINIHTTVSSHPCVTHLLIKIYFEHSGNWTAASFSFCQNCQFAALVLVETLRLYMDNDFVFSLFLPLKHCVVLISCKSFGLCVWGALVSPAGAAVAGRTDRTRLPALIGSLSHPVSSGTKMNIILAIRHCYAFICACL